MRVGALRGKLAENSRKSVRNKNKEKQRCREQTTPSFLALVDEAPVVFYPFGRNMASQQLTLGETKII